MENLNLDSDESVIVRITKLIISGAGREAVFTGKRLILLDNETGDVRDTVTYSDIALAAAGTNGLREPVITLALHQDDGTPRELELIFFHQAGGQNVRDRDRCIAVFHDHNVPVRAVSASSIPLPFLRKDNAEDRIPEGGEEEKQRPAVPEMTIFGTMAGSMKKSPKEPSPESVPVVLVAFVFLILAALIAGIFFLGPDTGSGTGLRNLTQGGTAAPTQSVTYSPETPVPATPEPATPAVPAETTRPAWDIQPGEIPPNGIWVRVTYPGRFTGSLSSKGWGVDINSTGSYLYQLPVHNTQIDGSIAKTDGSGNTMDVEFFNGGSLISKTSTSKPYGEVEIRQEVGTPVNSRPEVFTTRTIVTVVPTADPSLALHTVPSSGVWVRVAYPGSYTGTIIANGITKEVNSSEDQVYQFPMTSGTIDTFLEKGDGSDKNMVVQVYRDGSLVSWGNTTVPRGVVEIHTPV